MSKCIECGAPTRSQQRHPEWTGDVVCPLCLPGVIEDAIEENERNGQELLQRLRKARSVAKHIESMRRKP